MRKERFNLPEQKLTSGNTVDVSKLRPWLVGASLGRAHSAVTDLEGEVELKARLSEAKRRFASRLPGGQLPAEPNQDTITAGLLQCGVLVALRLRFD
ncbi:hypothetical protein [Bradyrhizobium elkanii]|uniref:hypothetical protein n=1 Tax=Bradyrhizobium elkanii TaxID=29448 RepID=UPI001BACC96A|nr:hypothetical protein [Bradyrhizobium elkanii]MBR1163143.1 hypothetical protein [Bradyrhizobium elkanii]